MFIQILLKLIPKCPTDNMSPLAQVLQGITWTNDDQDLLYYMSSYWHIGSYESAEQTIFC